MCPQGRAYGVELKQGNYAPIPFGCQCLHHLRTVQFGLRSGLEAGVEQHPAGHGCSLKGELLP